MREPHRSGPGAIARGLCAPLVLGAALCAPVFASADAVVPRAASPWKAARAELFEQLRADAALGDVRASGELARLLLDRFEAGGHRGDLHEAMHWIARDWDAQPLVWHGVAGRVVLQHCERASLRRHWLCAQDED